MKVLVTGGGGFLGRYIVEKLLEKGDDVSIFCRGKYPELEEIGVNVIRGNLKDRKSVRDAIDDHEIVFHVASKTDMFGKFEDFYSVNVVGTQNVVNGCIKSHVHKLIYTSSASVVFGRGGLKGVDESAPYPDKYLSSYPRSKSLAEQIASKANGVNGLKTTILRPHLIWGPRDPSLVPRFIDLAKKGRLPIIGPGDNRLDVTYVGNVADAHLLAAETPEATGETYFITQDDPIVPWNFLNELFSRLGLPTTKWRLPYRLAFAIGATNEFLFKLLGVEDKQPLLTRFLACMLSKSHYFDISKAKEELGYQPQISMEEGLDRYVEYYLDNH